MGQQGSRCISSATHGVGVTRPEVSRITRSNFPALNHIERMFFCSTDFRHIATRYDSLDAPYHPIAGGSESSRSAILRYCSAKLRFLAR